MEIGTTLCVFHRLCFFLVWESEEEASVLQWVPALELLLVPVLVPVQGAVEPGLEPVLVRPVLQLVPPLVLLPVLVPALELLLEPGLEPEPVPVLEQAQERDHRLHSDLTAKSSSVVCPRHSAVLC